jgi:hypothetical protein
VEGRVEEGGDATIDTDALPRGVAQRRAIDVVGTNADTTAVLEADDVATASVQQRVFTIFIVV